MEHTKRVLSFTRRAVDDYGMIRPHDKIAVGVSAGKDSLTLLVALAELRRFYPVPFELCAITVDMGFAGGTDFTPVREFCEQLDVPYHIVPTEIYKVIFEVRKESNPCSLCAKMRRGALNNAAKELGCTTVALGHHFDDAVDTFMLNLFFEGRIGCFQPVTYLSRQDLYVIRPMLYMPEKDIRYFTAHNALPVVKSACPANGNTEREEMKKLLTSLEHKYPGLRYRIFGAMQRGEVDGFHLPMTGRMLGKKEYSAGEESGNS
ncbi:MAG: tRNA 2-thiocytidine(32) synthetase TtcA [Clostridia bacterium]|nr:tRNA 2-thiocytidine(32) synthetase TtcA [Clostridia bacterium]